MKIEVTTIMRNKRKGEKMDNEKMMTTEEARGYLLSIPKIGEAYKTLGKIEAAENELINEGNDLKIECILQRIRIMNKTFRREICEFITEYSNKSIEDTEGIASKWEQTTKGLLNNLEQEREEFNFALEMLLLAMEKDAEGGLKILRETVERNTMINNHSIQRHN